MKIVYIRDKLSYPLSYVKCRYKLFVQLSNLLLWNIQANWQPNLGNDKYDETYAAYIVLFIYDALRDLVPFVQF